MVATTGVRREPRVGQREEVEVVVDEVELAGPLEDLRDVQRLPDLGVDRRVLLVADGADRMQAGAGQRVAGSEQRDVHPSADQTLGEQRDHLLPGSVVARRRAPGDGREHGDAQGERLLAESSAGPAELTAVAEWSCSQASRSETRAVARARLVSAAP